MYWRFTDCCTYITRIDSTNRCTPQFDSASIFGWILDKDWWERTLSWEQLVSREQSYIPNTPFVKTIVPTSRWSYECIDRMPPCQEEKTHPHCIVRTFTVLHWHWTISTQLTPRLDYGRQYMEKLIKNNIPAIPDHRVVSTPTHEVSWTINEEWYQSCRSWKTWESYSLILWWSDAQTVPSYPQALHFREQRLQEGNCTVDHTNTSRSAITLKLMQHYHTWALIAAPTTSLPEEIWWERNRDYRYTRVRDSTFIIYGLSLLGHTKEAERFFQFIQKILTPNKLWEEFPDLEVMYTIDGHIVHHEQTLSHRVWYRNSRPVRIWNWATSQFQLDGYGTLIDAYYVMRKKGVIIDSVARNVIIHLIWCIKQRRKEKDNWIWEVRWWRQHFTYSKVMCHVGIDRALRMHKQLWISSQLHHELMELRTRIHDWIWEHCYDSQRKLFVQHPWSNAIDATNFLFVMLQFLDRHETRTKIILENTYNILQKNEIFIHRYNGDDWLQWEEWAFLLCSYRMIGALSMVGEIERAQKYFDILEKQTTELLPEEIDAETWKYLWNYPQAFSHLGYVLASRYLKKYTKKFN